MGSRGRQFYFSMTVQSDSFVKVIVELCRHLNETPEFHIFEGEKSLFIFSLSFQDFVSNLNSDKLSSLAGNKPLCLREFRDSPTCTSRPYHFGLRICVY